jgi:hypothetical protein
VEEGGEGEREARRRRGGGWAGGWAARRVRRGRRGAAGAAWPERRGGAGARTWLGHQPLRLLRRARGWAQNERWCGAARAGGAVKREGAHLDDPPRQLRRGVHGCVFLPRSRSVLSAPAAIEGALAATRDSACTLAPVKWPEGWECAQGGDGDAPLRLPPRHEASDVLTDAGARRSLQSPAALDSLPNERRAASVEHRLLLATHRTEGASRGPLRGWIAPPERCSEAAGAAFQSGERSRARGSGGGDGRRPPRPARGLVPDRRILRRPAAVEAQHGARGRVSAAPGLVWAAPRVDSLRRPHALRRRLRVNFDFDLFARSG